MITYNTTYKACKFILNNLDRFEIETELDDCIIKKLAPEDMITNIIITSCRVKINKDLLYKKNALQYAIDRLDNIIFGMCNTIALILLLLNNDRYDLMLYIEYHRNLIVVNLNIYYKDMIIHKYPLMGEYGSEVIQLNVLKNWSYFIDDPKIKEFINILTENIP